MRGLPDIAEVSHWMPADQSQRSCLMRGCRAIVLHRYQYHIRVVWTVTLTRFYGILGGMTLLVGSLSAGISPTFAGEIQEYYRGARAMVKGRTLTLVQLDLAASSDLLGAYSQGAAAFKNLSGNDLNVIMGKNILAEATVSPSFVTTNFGLAYLFDAQGGVLAQNEAMPRITLVDQVTDGVQAAYGMSFGNGRKGWSGNSEFRLGFAMKYLYRRGGYRTLNLSELTDVGRGTLSQVMGSYGSGVGMDLGSQYIYKMSSHFNIQSSLVYSDVGDTSFSSGADSIKGNLTAGIAGVYHLGPFHTTVEYDMRHIQDQTDWRKKNHLGIEFAMPLISVQAGIDQVYPTYGASVDLWIIRLSGYSYKEDFGSFSYLDAERTYVFQFALKLGL